MSNQSRRKFLRTSGIAAGSLAVPGTAAAKETGGGPGDEKKLSISDRTVVTASDDSKIVAVSVARRRGNRSYSATDAETENFVFDVDTEDGSVSYTKVEGKQYESLTNSRSAMSVESAREEVSLMGDDDTDIVERSTTWGTDLGTCDAYSSHTHRYQAISAEFDQRVNDYSWTAIAAALIALVESALLSGGIALVGGIAAIVSGTDTITFGAQEYDISKFGWNQTMYSAKVAAGWRRSRSALTTVSTAPTHPTR